MKKRLAIITNIPSPYRRDLFVNLSSSPKITCKVFFSAEREQNRFWDTCNFLDFPHTFIGGKAISRRNGSITYIDFGLFQALRKFNPEIIIVGGASISALICLIYKRFNHCRVYIWWAGTTLSENYRHPMVKLFRKWLFHKSDGFFAYSKQCKDYLRKFNISNDNINVIGNNTLDATKYCGGLSKSKQKSSKEISAGLTILVVGQLIRRKNVITVLEAFLLLLQKYSNVTLKIAGSGPEEAQLKKYCTDNNMKNVFFLGNVHPENLINNYAESDVLISIALMDQWPQVVNESMACSVPVIASTTSGVDDTFIQDGINGYLINPLDKNRLYEILERFIQKPELIKTLGDKAFKTATSKDVNSVVKIIENVLASKP